MEALKVVIFAVGCVLQGIIGGIVARSLLAGIVLGVFVFVGWFLWRLFQLQNEKEGVEESETSKKE